MARIAIMDLEARGLDLADLLVQAGHEPILAWRGDPRGVDLVLLRSEACTEAAWQACARVAEAAPALPVLTAGGEASRAGAPRFLGAGARDHLVLPLSPDALASALERHLPGQPALPRRHPDLGQMSLALLEGLPMPAVAVDPEGRPLYLNAEAERVLACDRETAAREHHITDFFADPDRAERIGQVVRSAAPGEVTVLDLTLRSALGEEFPVRLFVLSLRDAEGVVQASICLCHDQRGYLQLKLELDEANRRVVESEIRAEASGGWREIAHQLNQPLTVAMGTLELLSTMEDVPPWLASRIQRVYEQLQRMAEYIRNLPHGPRSSTRKIGAS